MNPWYYTAPLDQFTNAELNSLGSGYGAQFGHDIGNVIARINRDIIYDAAPKQFYDLKLFNLKAPRSVPSDEFFYQEMGYGRSPLTVGTAGASAVTWPTKQTVPVNSVDSVSKDTIVTYPNNKKGTVTSVDTVAVTVTISPMNGDTLPAVVSGDTLANHSPVERDAADSISQYFRQGTIERTNYVQMIVKAMRFGKMELYKLQNAPVTSNYLSMEKASFMNQFRIDLSNIYWNGEKGEVVLADGTVDKTADGLYPIMVKAGSPNISAAKAGADDALEELTLLTNYGAEGEVKFLYGAPEHILNLSKLYKELLTRYAPNDMVAKLGLNEVDYGHMRVVFVPMKRLEDRSSFPSSFADRLFLIDQESVTPVVTWGEEIGETLDRSGVGTLQNYKDSWISGQMSCEFNNPLGSGWIDIV
jgi:hypothetical protein